MPLIHPIGERSRGRRLVAVLLMIFALLGASFHLWADTTSEGRSGRRVDSRGRKYVNKIPYDVFFEDPLKLVNENKTAVAPAESKAVVPTEPQMESVKTSTSTNAEENPWPVLLPVSELQSEVKFIRGSLSKALTNQGQYRQNVKAIATDGNELAALALIAQQHEGPLSWKDKAQFVREFSTQVSRAATGLTKEDFEKTKAAYQRLSSSLDGSIPADAGDVPAERPFHEASSRKGLMKRIEKARDWLKQDVNSDAKFKSKIDQIQHEAAMIAALAKVLTTTGYSYTENDDYQSFARTLIDGAKEASESSTEGGYEKFKQAIDKINKSCTDCHGTYGNS